jgi:hypothetical protein
LDQKHEDCVVTARCSQCWHYRIDPRLNGRTSQAKHLKGGDIMNAQSTTRRFGFGVAAAVLAALVVAASLQSPASAQVHPATLMTAKTAAKPTAVRPRATPILPSDTAGRVAALKVVNYQPRNHAWTSMWTNWRPSEFSADLARLKAMGANTIRLCVFPSVVGWPTPKGVGFAHFKDALAIAHARGMQVQLTLFDWWTPYDDVALSKTWLNGLLAGHRNDPRIALIELINEVDPNNEGQISWMKQVMPTLHKLAGWIPLTASVATTAGTDALAKLVTEMRPYGMSVADIHYYGLGTDAWDWMKRAKAAAQGLPLFIGEAGYTTYRTENIATDQKEQDQAQWFQLTLMAAKSLGVTAAPYMMYDLSMAAIPSNESMPTFERWFGLYRNDGTPRSAVATIRSLWTAKSPTSETFNTDFAHPSSDGTPLGWTRIGDTGKLTWDRKVGHKAKGSARLTGTGTDTVLTPSLLQSLPGPIRPGDTWQVSVSVLSQHSGKIRVGIAWYDASGKWLGTSTSSLRPNKLVPWDTITVKGVVPAGAAQADSMLMDAFNSGSVWFDDVVYKRISS